MPKDLFDSSDLQSPETQLRLLRAECVVNTFLCTYKSPCLNCGIGCRDLILQFLQQRLKVGLLNFDNNTDESNDWI